VSFFISTLAPLAEALRPWLHVSLFHYYTQTEPFGTGAELESMIVLLVVLALFLVAAVAAFRRKDLAV
jgi:ABC-type transport system involved in multi-copper enzyme maturation permease subunit